MGVDAQPAITMQLVVLGSPRSWYTRDLTRAAAGRHLVMPATFCDLATSLGGNATGQETRGRITSGDVDLSRTDCVLVRTMPPGSLEQVVFRMDALGRLEAAGVAVINPPRSIEVAVDKYLATARLEAAGLLTPRTEVLQTWGAAMEAFERLGGDVVVKPLFGAEGRGITRLADEALALRAFKMLEQLGAVIYLQEFVEHEGFDLRLLVIGRRVLGIRRRNPLDWRTNLSRGARAEPLEVTGELAEVAQRAAEVVGAPLAGVDLLPGKDGRLYAIEVNAVPGWKGLAKALEIDVGRMVVELLEETVREKMTPGLTQRRGDAKETKGTADRR